MGQNSVQINAAVHAYNSVNLDSAPYHSLASVLLLVKRAIKGKLHKRGKLKTGGSCRTVIQDEKRISVEAIKQISGASKVERHSQERLKIYFFKQL